MVKHVSTGPAAPAPARTDLPLRNPLPPGRPAMAPPAAGVLARRAPGQPGGGSLPPRAALPRPPDATQPQPLHTSRDLKRKASDLPDQGAMEPPSKRPRMDVTHGFTGIAPLTARVNDHDLTQNCYFTTAAALSNKTADQLVNESGHMQQQTGSVADTQELLQAVGHATEARMYNNSLHAKVHLTQTMKDDRAFALGYFRPEDPWTGQQNAGHMVVGVKTGGQLATVDYQQTPPALGPFPPRDMAMDSRLHVIVPNTSPPGTPR